jgi:hypothetical protein
VLFNLNNMQQSVTVNSIGPPAPLQRPLMAFATFQVPLLAFLSSQTLTVEYQGSSDTSGDIWEGSTFLAPLYKNFYNVLFSGTLAFNQLTPQQVYAEEISAFQNPSGIPTTLAPYNTAQGETNTLLGGALAFNYVDPGTISTVSVLGITQLPGIFAVSLGAYNGLT